MPPPLVDDVTLAGLHFVVFDADGGSFESHDYRFEAIVDGQPLTLTRLLEMMATVGS